METNRFNEKLADKWRFFGVCGSCKEDKFFVSRVIIETPVGKVISPSHFCKPCKKIIRSKLETV